MNGVAFGIPVPPVILIWGAVAAFLIYALRNTLYGRHLYALGGNRGSAGRLMISERRYWVGAYMASGVVSAMTGSLLLGWSGGGFIGVGQPYLFMTLAAIVTLVSGLHYVGAASVWIETGKMTIIHRYIGWALTQPLLVVTLYFYARAVAHVPVGIFWRTLVAAIVMVLARYMGEAGLMHPA